MLKLVHLGRPKFIEFSNVSDWSTNYQNKLRDCLYRYFRKKSETVRKHISTIKWDGLSEKIRKLENLNGLNEN